MIQNKTLTQKLIGLVLFVFLSTNFLNVLAFDDVRQDNNEQQDFKGKKHEKLKEFKGKMKFKDLSAKIQEKDSTKKTKKIDVIKKSIKNNGKYKLLIKSNDNLENISNFFLNYDQNIQIKQVGNNTYEIITKDDSDLYNEMFTDIDNGQIPETLFDKYEVVQPEIIEIQDLDTTGEQTDQLRWADKIGLNSYLSGLGTTNKVKVGVIDSGIYKDHSDLKNNIDSADGYDFVEDDSDAQDENGHGTHIAGIIGGEINGSGIYGVNPNAELVPLKVVDANGIGSSYDLIEAINYAKDNGIKLINISLGGYGDPANSPICAAITSAKNTGVITVVAAGNSNIDIGTVVPAGCTDAITVGAVDQNLSKANFSNYGNNIKISAPGTNIYSTWKDGGYQTLDGTSQSSAIVAGAVSLFLAQDSSLNHDTALTKLNTYSSGGVLNLLANNTNSNANTGTQTLTGSQNLTGSQTLTGNFNLTGSIYGSGFVMSGLNSTGTALQETGLYYSGLFLYSGMRYGNSYYNSSFDFPQSVLDQYGVEVLSGVVDTTSDETLMSTMSVPTNGLVGEWLLNGNANDTSGLGHNGTAYNMDWGNGRINGVYRGYGVFNGGNSRIDLDGYHGFTAENATLSLWIYINADGNFYIIGEQRDKHSNSLQIQSGIIYYSYLNNFDDSYFIPIGEKQGIKAKTTIPNYTWTHVAIVRQGLNQSLYINGVLDATGHSFTDNYYQSTLPFRIGVVENVLNNFVWWLNGRMSTIRMYNRALTQSEITRLYNEGQIQDETNSNIPTDYQCDSSMTYCLMTDQSSAIHQTNQELQFQDAITHDQNQNNEGDPINLAKGEFTYSNTLMSVPGNGMPFQVDVNYRNQVYYNGPVGINWDHNYNIFLTGNEDGSISYYNGKLGIFKFALSGSEFVYNDGLKANLMLSGSNYIINFDNGNKYFFGTNNKVSQMMDKYGNHLDFSYDSNNLLSSVIDTLGRNITYNYEDNRLSNITDFNGRQVEFEYYADSGLSGSLYDLKDIVINNGGATKTISFTYTTGDDTTGHNLVNLYDSKGQLYVHNAYTGDRVASQTYGDGTIYYSYTLSGDVITQNSVTNKNGIVTNYTYNEMGNNTLMQIYNADQTSSQTYSYTYDSNGRLVKEAKPKGNGYKYFYDDKGNVSQKRFKQYINATDSSEDLVTNYTYTGFDMVSQTVDPNGVITDFDIDNNGNVVRKTIHDVADFSGSSENVVTNYEYDSNGYLTKTTDPEGNIVNFQYTSGSLTKLIKGTGDNTIENDLTYDEYGNVLSQIDGEGFSKTYAYNSFNLLTTGTTALGIQTLYSYDLNNNKTNQQILLSGGNTASTSYTYDILDNVVQTSSDIDSSRTVIENKTYDNNGNIKTVQLSGGALISFDYNEFDKIITKTIKPTSNTADDIVYSYTYDHNGNLLSETDALNHTKTYTYDLFDRIVEKADGQRNRTTYTYDNNGNITQTQSFDANDNLMQKVVAEYDELGRIITQKTYKNLTTFVNFAYKYDKNGKILVEIDSKGNQTTNIYDIFGRLSEKTDALGNKIKYSYDKRDLTTKKEILSNTGKSTYTTYEYDHDGRLVKETDNTGEFRSYEYNNLNQITRITDKNGNITDFQYDYAGHKTRETKYNNSQNVITQYNYDVFGNLVEAMDQNGNTTNYAYDKLNRLIQQTDAKGKIVNYTYDKNSNLISKTDPNGTQITNDYDSLGRLIQRNIALGTGVGGITQENYAYDGLSRLMSGTDSQGNTLNFGYDMLGRLTNEVNSNTNVGYQYDDNGNLTKVLKDSNDVLEYDYDQLNRPTTVKYQGNTVNTYNYSGINLDSQELGNGKNISYEYDSLDRISKLNNSITTYNYVYDKEDNLTADGLKSYVYDDLYRVVQASGANNQEILDYDNAGNRLEYQSNAGATQYSGNELNQYLATSGVENQSFAYDDNGNIVNNGKYAFQYDYKNRLIKVWTGETTIAQYSYDLLGRRISKTVGSAMTTYIYSNNDILAEVKTDSGRTLEKNYINGLGTDNVIGYVFSGEYADVGLGGEIEFCNNRVNNFSGEFLQYNWTGIVERCEYLKNNAFTSGSMMIYYVKDRLGSVVGLQDMSGNTLLEYEYDVFGKTYVKAGMGEYISLEIYTGNSYNNDRLFTSREYDRESGLYFYRARYYDANLGRFISQDPIGITDDVNLYAYVGNNAINRVDPSGLEKKIIRRKIVYRVWLERFIKDPKYNNEEINGVKIHKCNEFVGDAYREGGEVDNYPYNRHFGRRGLTKQYPRANDLADPNKYTDILSYSNDINTAKPGDIIIREDEAGISGHSAIYVGNKTVIYAGSDITGGLNKISLDEMRQNMKGGHYKPIVRSLK